VGLWNFSLLGVMSIGSGARRALTDEELASRYKATGDKEYFAQIFLCHRRLVFCACRRFFRGSGLAEDATQETFLRAYEGFRRFQEGNVRGWLMCIARNVCIDLWRKRRLETQLPEVASMDLADPVKLDHRTGMSLALRKVHEEMKLLPPEQRRCLEMKMEGYSYVEIAKRRGLSLDAVKSHLQNGRRMLWLRVQGFLSELP
jgi:RNA polymerase sigma factor (sigma-70 family)